MMEQKEPKFKIGEECMFEFQKGVVKETSFDGRITTISYDGFFTGGNDLSYQCYPVNEKTIDIAKKIKKWSNTCLNCGFNSLNYPDLRRKWIQFWIRMCESADDDKKLKEIEKELDIFGSSVLFAVKEVKKLTIGGIKIFGR